MFDFDANRFSGEVPLFPLPAVVLVPSNLQSFHLFEARYRAMLQDVMASEGFLAVPLLRAGWESDYEGRPPVHEICGLGCIRHCVRHDDGRGDILLASVARVRILRELAGKPYRIARVEVLDDVYPADGSDLSEARDRLLERLCLPETMRQLPAGQVADLVLGQMQLEPLEKQEIFEELSVAARLQRLHVVIDRIDEVRALMETGRRLDSERPDLN
jgi:Lon protease-like protein